MGTFYGQLSLAEREEIGFRHRSGMSLRCIAALLGRAASTISREIARNTRVTKQWPKPDEPRVYLASRAQALTQRRRRWRASRFKLVRQPDLLAAVETGLAMGWSPQQIAGRLTRENGSPVISHESIYRYIYFQANQRNPLHRGLPQRRAYRRPRKSSQGMHLRFGVPGYTDLAHRPKAADARRQIGHWEADLMLFSKPAYGLLVVVERASRYLLMSRNDSRATQPTIDNLIGQFCALPKHKRRTVTFDQGKEFWSHKRLKQACGVETYFCKPHAPWQKGTVENTIGRLRRYLPRGVQYDEIQPDKIRQRVEAYKNTPRKCLGYRTPKEVYLNQTVALDT